MSQIMKPRTVVISINSAWNIVNFRLDLIRSLLAEGHRVVALAPGDEHSARLHDAGVLHRGIKIDKQGLSPLRDLGLLFRYRAALRDLKPDVFLSYTAKPNVYGSLAAQSLGIKVINNVSGLGTAFIRQGLLQRIVSALYRISLRRSATVFFQNADDRDLFVAKRLVQPDQARLLPGSGINLAHFAAVTLPATANEEMTFLLIGRLLRDKGVVEFVEAARSLRASYPSVRFQLLGFADVENRTAISRADVDQWMREGVIEYLGATDDVRPAIAAADCIVLPSYREGMPRTLLEAAAMARPLIATDVPGCRHIVTHRVNGLLCRARDAGSLATAMRQMIDAGPELRGAWGRAGRDRVEREFDAEIVARSYLDAIENAFAGA